MSSAGLEGVRAAVQKHIDNHNLPGAVTVVARHNKLVWYEAQGVRDPQTMEPLRKDDLFRMMSSSKPVTAVAVMMMLEAGKLSLDDKISRFIPSFANPRVAVPPEGWEKAMAYPAARTEMLAKVQLVPALRELTIKDLLTHTNGLGTGGPGTMLGNVPWAPDGDLADYVTRLGRMPLDFQPGSRFSYSPINAFDVLLRLVEITSGVPADVFVRERILQPLDMHDTYFRVPSAKMPRLVSLNEWKNDKWVPAAPLFGYGPTQYCSGAGGLVSTARDYMQFEAMLLNRGALNGRRLLKPETVALMASNHVGDLYKKAIPAFPAITAGRGFGLGVSVTLEPELAKTGRGRGAFGWNGAYGTDSWADPEFGVTAAFFVQSPSFIATMMADADFQHAVRAAIVT
ncbi:MAG: serine hydrolase domain-containing protein [Novosphingobium sp.]